MFCHPESDFETSSFLWHHLIKLCFLLSDESTCSSRPNHRKSSKTLKKLYNRANLVLTLVVPFCSSCSWQPSVGACWWRMCLTGLPPRRGLYPRLTFTPPQRWGDTCNQRGEGTKKDKLVNWYHLPNVCFVPKTTIDITNFLTTKVFFWVRWHKATWY